MNAQLASRAGAAALLCAALAVAGPFLCVQFPPVADLPQLVAQVRLFDEARAEPEGPYRIQWETPHSLAHGLLALGWMVGGPEQAGRLGVLAVALLSLAACALLARRFRRPWPLVLAAACLIFNHNLYWGFLSFALGWPVFAGFLCALETSRKPCWDALLCGLWAGGLYASHGLWFLAGGLWLLLRSWQARAGWRELGVRCLGFVPWLLPAWLWRQQASAMGFSSEALWRTWPWQRLEPRRFTDSLLGGLHGWTELVLVAVLLVLALVLVWQARRRPVAEEPGGAPVSRLIWAAACLAAAYFCLPESASNTISLNRRWLPYAGMLGLLALPLPRLRWRVELWLPALALLSLSVISADLWMAFEEFELEGLQQSIEALPDEPRVLGLDMTPSSWWIKRKPFLQSFAWAQVFKGGRLSFSFAEHGSALVVFADRERPPWTPHLEWFAERVQASDYDHFDFVIVHCDTLQGVRPSMLPGFARLQAISPDAPFRAWRVLPSAGPDGE